MDRQFCPYCMAPADGSGICPVCGQEAAAYVPSPHHLPPGSVLLDRYVIGRVLGEGGFGITYIGYDLRLELKIAVKEYYPVGCVSRSSSVSPQVYSFVGASGEDYEKGRQRFLDEVRIMARMEKQQVIVGARDYFEANNTVYIAMEYVNGTTFRRFVEQRGDGIPPEELFPLIEPLFHALSMLHENGLIHRDISPDNLMLENGEVRLLDFGCARETSVQNRTMTIAIKHGYAPLEQYQQKGQGPWTDIYALCATIYFCLTGQAPPYALDRIAQDSLVSPAKLGVSLTPRQERALMRGMRLQPRRRIQTVEELRRELYAAPEAEKEEETAPGPEKNPVESFEYMSGEDPERHFGDKSGEDPEGIIRYQSEEDPEGIIRYQSGEDPEGASGQGFHAGNDAVSETGTVQTDEQKRKIPWIGIGVAVIAMVFIASNSGMSHRKTLDTQSVAAAETVADIAEQMKAENSGADLPQLPEEIQKMVASEDSLFEDAIHVTSEFGLMQAARTKEPVVIDTDLVLNPSSEYDGNNDIAVLVDRPVRISRGVTVSLKSKSKDLSYVHAEADGILFNHGTLHGDIYAGGNAAIVNYGIMNQSKGNGYGYTYLEENTTLLNYGTFYGEINANDGAYIENYGQMTKMPEEGNGMSLYAARDTVFVNYGEMRLDECSRFWRGSEFYNCGDVYAYDFYMNGGSMRNLGNVTVPANEGRFVIGSGSSFTNDGSVTVKSGGTFENRIGIVNNGEILAKSGAYVENVLMDNQGEAVFEEGADADPFKSRVIFGDGETELNGLALTVYSSTGFEYDREKRAPRTASTAEELKELLADEQTEAVAVDGELAVDEKLVLTKDLYLDGQLQIREGGSLVVKGAVVCLGEGGRLGGKNLRFLENAELVLRAKDSALSLAEGDSLTLRHAVLRGSGKVSLQNAGLTLRDHAVFAPAECETSGQSAVLVKSGSLLYSDGFEFDQSSVELQNAAFACSGDTRWYGGSLDVGPDSLFYSNGNSLNLTNCAVRIADGAEFLSEFVDLGLLGDTRVVNEGKMSMGGWDEETLRLRGELDNRGEFYLSMTTELSGTIRNRGVMRGDRELTKDLKIEGNPPILED